MKLTGHTFHNVCATPNTTISGNVNTLMHITSKHTQLQILTHKHAHIHTHVRTRRLEVLGETQFERKLKS